jgi:hypothetical protein
VISDTIDPARDLELRQEAKLAAQWRRLRYPLREDEFLPGELEDREQRRAKAKGIKDKGPNQWTYYCDDLLIY